LHKVVFLGLPGVGKTSFLAKWTDHPTPLSPDETIGVDFITKKKKLHNGDELAFQCWDVWGKVFLHKDFLQSSALRSYLGGAEALVIMWDATEVRTSPDSLPEIFDTIFDKIKDKLRRGTDTPLIFLAGKMDLLNPAWIEVLAKQESAIKQKASDLGFTTLECVRTSAKDGTGIEALETILVEKLAQVSEIPAAIADEPNRPKPTKEYKPTQYQHIPRDSKKIETTTSAEHKYKILLVGPCEAGKTTLLKRLRQDIFSPQSKYRETIFADFIDWECTLNNGDVQTIEVCDVSGKELEKKYHSLGYFAREKDVILFMWDTANSETFEVLQKWIRNILVRYESFDGTSPVVPPIIFVAGKIDLLDEAGKEALSKQEAILREKEAYGLSDVACVRVSAKDNTGIPELRRILIEKVQLNRNKLAQTNETTKPNEKKEYVPDPYQHTRQVRYNHISRIIKNSPEGLSNIDRVWLDMNLVSIKDPGCKTAKLIQQNLKDNPKQNRSSKPQNEDPDFEKKFDTVFALLKLMSEMETQILGFKFVFSIFEKNRTARREQQHKDIAAIYDVARHIYDSMFPAAKEISTESTESVVNSNHAAALLEDNQSMRDVLKSAHLPDAARKIINKLIQDPKTSDEESSQHDYLLG